MDCGASRMHEAQTARPAAEAPATTTVRRLILAGWLRSRRQSRGDEQAKGSLSLSVLISPPPLPPPPLSLSINHHYHHHRHHHHAPAPAPAALPTLWPRRKPPTSRTIANPASRDQRSSERTSMPLLSSGYGSPSLSWKKPEMLSTEYSATVPDSKSGAAGAQSTEDGHGCWMVWMVWMDEWYG
jgi:hypothetical protein